MKSARRRGEAVLAALVAGAAVVLVVGAGVLYFGSTVIPVHTNPAAIPSAAADVDAGRYVAAVDEARRLARALLVKENLPGLSVAVAVDGAIVWTEGFGYAAEDRTPVTPLTRFRLGALSKPMTSVAAALLHDRGRLDLDAPVQRYVPAYPQKQWTVTTRQLMGDVAGVHRSRGDNIDGDSMPNQHCASLDEAVELFAGDQLRFEPGTQHRYSIYGWVLVSAVVERAGGEPFTRFMERQVFKPLGMDRTVVADREGLDDATSYAPRSILRDPARHRGVGAAGVLLPGRRWGFSLHADGPGATRLCAAEARAAEGGDHHVSPDSHAPRLWSVHDLRARLDGWQRPASGRAGKDGQPSGKPQGRYRLTPDVPGSRSHGCRRRQHDGCHTRQPPRAAGRRRIRQTSESPRRFEEIEEHALAFCLPNQPVALLRALSVGLAP